jgi:hypothetical protein
VAGESGRVAARDERPAADSVHFGNVDLAVAIVDDRTSPGLKPSSGIIALRKYHGLDLGESFTLV